MGRNNFLKCPPPHEGTAISTNDPDFPRLALAADSLLALPSRPLQRTSVRCNVKKTTESLQGEISILYKGKEGPSNCKPPTHLEERLCEMVERTGFGSWLIWAQICPLVASCYAFIFSHSSSTKQQ